MTRSYTKIVCQIMAVFGQHFGFNLLRQPQHVVKIYLNLGRSKSGDYVCYVFHVLGVNQPHEK
jgi:hypothetical protein